MDNEWGNLQYPLPTNEVFSRPNTKPKPCLRKKPSAIWFPFILTVVVDQKDIAFKTELYLAFFHERKSLLADKREQAGASTSGMRLQGMGKWELVCLIISTIWLFKWYAYVCLCVCLSVCIYVYWVAWRKIHNYLIAIMSGCYNNERFFFFLIFIGVFSL